VIGWGRTPISKHINDPIIFLSGSLRLAHISKDKKFIVKVDSEKGGRGNLKIRQGSMQQRYGMATGAGEMPLVHGSAQPQLNKVQPRAGIIGFRSHLDGPKASRGISNTDLINLRGGQIETRQK
jgi:hypothetical protein